jgi:hypothetical protein
MRHLITFSGGNVNYYDMYGQFVNYYDAACRLIKQAADTHLFDQLTHVTDVKLQNEQVFWSDHSQFITQNPKGYGYWLWKPYIIKKQLDTIQDNDILLYCDAGCEIDLKNTNMIETMFDQVSRDLIVGSEVGLEWGCERRWCKRDLYTYLNFEDHHPSLMTQQRQATAVCFLKCDKVVDLVNQWYQIACKYHMIDDTPSLSQNLENFVEHRHDQAIFSLLTKKYNIFSNFSIRNAIYLYRTKNGKTRII